MEHIQIFNQSQYSNFDEAKQAGAVYSTSSDIDATVSYTACMDAEEVVFAVADCLGCKEDIVAGIETDKGFITLSELAKQLSGE